MMSMSFSMTSLRSFGSAKSLASFVDELSTATRLAEVASTGAAARSMRRRPRPDSSVLPDTFFADPSPSPVVVPIAEIEDVSRPKRRRVRPESVLPGLLFAKTARVAGQHVEHDEDESESIRVATVGARRRVRPESILPGLLFAKPSQVAAHNVDVENPKPAMPEAVSTSSIASMSSSKSLTSFKRDLFATGRLGDLNTSGFEARAYRRRVRAVSAEQQTTPVPMPKPSVGANAAAKSSTMSLSSRPLAERSPFVKYTQSGTLNLSSVRDRSGKWIGASPSLFADIEPEQEFRLRGALLLPGMQFTSGTVGAEKGDVLRSLTGDVANEKVSRVEKLRQVFKRG